MQIVFKATNNMSSDGRGPDEPSIYFKKQSDSKKATEGKSAYDGDGTVTEIIIYDTFSEYESILNGKLKKQALAKLSPAERKALGF